MYPELFLAPLLVNPNPSRGDKGVYFAWRLSAPATMEVTVYSVAGQLVRRLPPFRAGAGPGEQHWDALNDHHVPVASGVFFAKISAVSDTGKRQQLWEQASILR